MVLRILLRLIEVLVSMERWPGQPRLSKKKKNVIITRCCADFFFFFFFFFSGLLIKKNLNYVHIMDNLLY